MRVNGQQYLWRYEYPGPAGTLFSYYKMVVPTHTTVTLKITSQDVAHSWWIPKLGGKALHQYDKSRTVAPPAKQTTKLRLRSIRRWHAGTGVKHIG